MQLVSVQARFSCDYIVNLFLLLLNMGYFWVLVCFVLLFLIIKVRFWIRLALLVHAQLLSTHSDTRKEELTYD